MLRGISAGTLTWLVWTSSTGTAWAQPDYPSMLQKNFEMGDCLPQCSLCHLDPQGGGDRSTWGNQKGTAAALASQLTVFDEDFDGDTFTDRAELRAGSNPHDRLSTPVSAIADQNLSICVAAQPTYGCGARLARGNERSAASAWLALAAASAFGLMIARRRRA